MSSVGSSCISPDALCLHAKTESWNCSVSLLSLRSVSSTLPVRPERKIWVGSTVKVAADAAPACGPPHNHATARAVTRNRPAMRLAGLPAEITCITQKVSDEECPRLC